MTKTTKACAVLAVCIAGFLVLRALVITPARAKQPIVAEYRRRPLTFEANQGQSDPQVRFISRAQGYTAFFTATETVFVAESSRFNVHIKLLGDSAPQVEGLGRMPAESNYLMGNDPSKWRTHIPHYSKVRYRNVYAGIDTVYYGNQEQMEQDFVIAPGADPQQIHFRVTGAEAVYLDEQGDLIIRIRESEMRLRKPTVYQEQTEGRKQITGEYSLTAGNDVGFALGDYDRTKPMIVDPVLAFSTYLGGSGAESLVAAVAVDSAGNAYVTGQTGSSDFPTASPAVQGEKGSGNSAFVSKLSSDGTHLVYSTYLGGSNGDGRYIAVDRLGSAYVTGRANSSDYPTTANAFQRIFAGGPSDTWIAKLSADGSSLVYCTYLGGSGTENGNGLTVDDQGNAIVAGATNSPNFPAAAALQPQLGGNFDGFIAKLNPDGSRLIYSTYVGGTNEDRAWLVSVDAQLNAYVVGRTASMNFPTANAVQNTYGGGAFDGFVVKVSADGKLVYSTYFGGSGDDVAGANAIDNAGNVTISGVTNSTDLPTVNALQPALAAGACGPPARACYDAFIAKLKNDGSALIYSTYFGGHGEEGSIDGGTVVAVDTAGYAYIAGRTASFDFPLANPLQATYGGGAFDGFVAKLSPDGSTLIYSTYMGGRDADEIWDIKVNGGDAYVAGLTSSTDFPTTHSSQQTYGGGIRDAFAAKIREIPAMGVFYFSQAGGGGGFSTGVALTNPSTTKTVIGTVSFFGPDGRPLNIVAANAVVPFTVQPSRTTFINTNTLGAFASAYARISSNEGVFANATYFLPGMPSLAVAPSRVGSLFAAAAYVDLAQGRNEGIALMNTSEAPARIRISLLDSSDNELLSSTVTLSAGGQLSRFLSELMPQVPNRYPVVLRIEALPTPFTPAAISLAVTIIEFGPNQLREVPVTVIR